MQAETKVNHTRRLVRAPKLQHLDPSRIADLDDSRWKRSMTLTHVDGCGRETKIRVRKSIGTSEAGEMKVADIGCRFDVDGRVAGFCEMATFRARPLSVPSDCYPEMDGHSHDGWKLNLLLQTRFDEQVLDYGSIVILRRIQFLPTCRPGAWIEPFNHLLDQLFCADEWSFMIGTPFPLEYEAHQHDEQRVGDPEAFERRIEALSRLYASRLGFQRLRNADDEWVWRPIGPRCTVAMIRGLILPSDHSAPTVDPHRAGATGGSDEVVNDFDARP